MLTDRTTLRRAIGDRLGDMLVLGATHVGTTDTFRDTVHLGDRGDDAPSVVNKIAYLSGQSHEARITAFAGSTSTLTFSPVAAAAPVVGTELELWSVSARIGSIATIHRLINDAIRVVSDSVSTEAWDTAQTFQARAPELDIPATWVEFGGADWVDGSGYRHEVPASLLRVRPGTRTVELLGRPSWRANNRQIQLWGYAEATALTADTGTDGETDVDSEWLVETVLAAIALAASWKASDIRGPSEERRANFWATQAMTYRRNVSAPRRGLGISL